MHALRPESLELARLSDALADVAERWSSLHGISVQVTTTGTVRPVSQQAEFVLLRTAQEALANVAKHARATRVGLTLSYMPGEVALDVRDDGRGFDPARLRRGYADSEPADGGASGSGAAGSGFGLIAMRQRIADLAGTLQVESELGGGTAISARVPAMAALADALPRPPPARWIRRPDRLGRLGLLGRLGRLFRSGLAHERPDRRARRRHQVADCR